MSLLDMLWVPPVRFIFFVCRIAYKICFSWWYDPWQQKKANEALWYALEAKLYCITSKGELVNEKKPAILPFDYASIKVIFENVCFCFTRGRGEFNVTLSPLRVPSHIYHLEWVLAALDANDPSVAPRIDTLDDVAQVLGHHLGRITKSFSEVDYPVFREKMLEEKESERILIRQSEWALNQQLYGNRGRHAKT
jgi:hypothetical protein